MTARIASLFFGILLIPVHIGYSVAFYRQMLDIRGVESSQMTLFFGVTAYLAVHTFFKPSKKLYEVGQKVIDISFLWMQGGKDVAGAGKGKAQPIRFTDLIPFVIPVYTILVTVIYGVASMFTNVVPWTRWFFLALGFTMTFHLVFTIDELKDKHAQMGWMGWLLNIGFIYWVNLLVLIGVVNLVVPHLSVVGYIQDGFNGSYEIFRGIYEQLFSV